MKKPPGERMRVLRVNCCEARVVGLGDVASRGSALRLVACEVLLTGRFFSRHRDVHESGSSACPCPRATGAVHATDGAGCHHSCHQSVTEPDTKPDGRGAKRGQSRTAASERFRDGVRGRRPLGWCIANHTADTVGGWRRTCDAPVVPPTFRWNQRTAKEPASGARYSHDRSPPPPQDRPGTFYCPIKIRGCYVPHG